MEEKKFLTIAEAAKVWGVSKISACYYIHQAKLIGLAEVEAGKSGSIEIKKSDALALASVPPWKVQ